MRPSTSQRKVTLARGDVVRHEAVQPGPLRGLAANRRRIWDVLDNVDVSVVYLQAVRQGVIHALRIPGRREVHGDIRAADVAEGIEVVLPGEASEAGQS